MAGATVKQDSSNLVRARESELAMKRKPFSPISPAANMMEDLNRKHNELWQKLLTINSTPPRSISRAEQENRTPQKTMTTPSTVSIPMHTALTPASIQTTNIFPALSSSKSVEEEIEYSFEEMRARRVHPISPLMNVPCPKVVR